MPPRDQALPGAPCWVDLFSSDLERALEFYGTLLDWDAESSGAEYGGYVTFSHQGRTVAGAMANQPGSDIPDCWTVYLASDDARATAESASRHGAQVNSPAMEVGDLGVMAVLTDPGGATIGVWQSGEHRGFEVWAEPGAPGWFELHTRDHDGAVAFYRDVFGWETHVASDTDEFRYTTLGEDESSQAGIMDASGFLPDGVPAHWSVYFAVADTDATLQQTLALGGAVVQPAEDTPYGRLATASDPTGAVFKLLG